MKLNREQTVEIVEIILMGVLDRVESSLPTSISWEDYANGMRRLNIDPLNYFLDPYGRGALEAAGMQLGIMYHRLTDDGAGIYDALRMAGEFDLKIEKLVSESWKDKGYSINETMEFYQHAQQPCVISNLYGDLWPDCRKCAEAFVDTIYKTGTNEMMDIYNEDIPVSEENDLIKSSTAILKELETHAPADYGVPLNSKENPWHEDYTNLKNAVNNFVVNNSQPLTEKEKAILNRMIEEWAEMDGPLDGTYATYAEAFQLIESLGLKKPEELFDRLQILREKLKDLN